MTMRNALLAATLLLLAACDRDNSGAVPTTADPVPSDSPPAAPVAIPDPGAELRAELGRVLAGPSGNTSDTIQTWFSASTAHALRSATVDSAGHAIVDFQDLRAIIPNASSSAGSTILLQELNAAVFHVPGIRSVEYRIDGSCDAFWEWLQYGCQTVTRESFASGL